MCVIEVKKVMLFGGGWKIRRREMGREDLERFLLYFLLTIILRPEMNNSGKTISPAAPDRLPPYSGNNIRRECTDPPTPPWFRLMFPRETVVTLIYYLESDRVEVLAPDHLPTRIKIIHSFRSYLGEYRTHQSFQLKEASNVGLYETLKLFLTTLSNK